MKISAAVAFASANESLLACSLPFQMVTGSVLDKTIKHSESHKFFVHLRSSHPSAIVIASVKHSASAKDLTCVELGLVTRHLRASFHCLC